MIKSRAINEGLEGLLNSPRKLRSIISKSESGNVFAYADAKPYIGDSSTKEAANNFNRGFYHAFEWSYEFRKAGPTIDSVKETGTRFGGVVAELNPQSKKIVGMYHVSVDGEVSRVM